MIQITPHWAIREDELTFTTSRSSGPGGQNVNKLNTRVTLLFDLPRSTGLSPAQKARVADRLATRISRDGVLRVVSQRHRSQKANRDAAVARFVELLQAALRRQPVRIETRVPRRAEEHRLQRKKLRGRTKRERSWRPGPED